MELGADLEVAACRFKHLAYQTSDPDPTTRGPSSVPLTGIKILLQGGLGFRF